MNIILADSHGTVLGKDQTSANLSLLYLGSYLKAKMPEVNLEYLPQARTGERHLERIRDFKCDVYAVSFTSFSALKTFELIKQIKKAYPNVLVVTGGPHNIDHSEDILRISGADLSVIGEGEQTFYEIVSNYKNIIEARKTIDGIAYLENYKFVKTPSRALIDDIDTIPFPDRSLVNDADYCGLTYSKARPNTEMIITRGCPLRCVFCANPVFRIKGGPLFRSRSAKNITDEVKQLYERGYREIYLHSDELNVSLNWSIEVCKAIAELGYKDLYFQCNLRVIPMSEELAYWMAKANFWMVRIGIESTSDRVLKGIKKHMSYEKTEASLKMLRKQGIKTFGYMMLFNMWEDKGEMQFETSEEVNKTIKDIYRLWRKGLINYTSWSYAVPVQGSELYSLARKHKWIDENFYPSDQWDAFKHLKGVAKKDFNRLYAKSRRQTAIMAIRSGNFEWRNYKGIARKARTMIFGRPN